MRRSELSPGRLIRQAGRRGDGLGSRRARRPGRRWAAALAVGLAASFAIAMPARAQVNTENLRKRIKAKGYSVIVEGTLTGDVGNTQGISVGAGRGGGWAKDPHLLFAYGRVDHAKYNGTTSVDKSFAHARYNYEFAPWLWGEAFAQAQSDAFQRLDLRNLFGLGPRIRAAHVALDRDGEAVKAGKTPEETFDVFLGLAYMFERDAVTAVVGSTGPENQSVQIWHRASTYLTLQWQIDSRAVVATTLYAQPALTDFRNVRVLEDTALTFRITKVFTAGIAASVHYDSEPPTGVLPADLEIKNTLGLVY